MLNKLKSNRKEGFTIIEVMIVLAIAALILLIVLLAVPALQRSSRNTQRKNDVGAISTATSNLITDNGGTLPSGLGNDSDTSLLDVCAQGGAGQSGTTACTAGDPIETAKLGYFKNNSIWFNTTATAGTLFTPNVVATGSESVSKVSTDSVIVAENENCNSTGTAPGSYGTRYIAIFYVVETGTGNGNLQCVEP